MFVDHKMLNFPTNNSRVSVNCKFKTSIEDRNVSTII